MESTNLNHEDKKDQHNHHHCCCCCHCCCYNNGITEEQDQSLDIPPWSPSPTNDYKNIPNMESICSCCSCISIKEAIDMKEEEEEEEEEELPSTGCTTPIDLKVSENTTLDTIEKSRKKKLHAIEELLQTERDYVQDLSHLVEVCLEVLSRQTWIPNEHKSIISRNSSEILTFHKQFIFSFDIENSSAIAKTFIDQMDQFSHYKHYCDMHAEAWALASEYRDKPEWNNFLKECTIVDSYSIPLNLNHLLLYEQQQKKLHFEDYLIKPVQRICRYQLLIKEIIKYTLPQTTEYDLWSIVLSEMQDIVTDIDDRKFQRDMKERTDRFINRLDGDWRISKRHVSQLGNLLIAGAIEITYSALGQTVSKPRYLGCFIFQTYVIMVRPKKVTSYEPKHWFPLRMTDFEDLIDIEGQREHSFILRCKKHAFAFSASCSQEKQLWVKKIQEAIVTAKIEASDENLSAQDFIVSSLPGITSKRSPQSIRLSRSFTNLLDMTLSANNESLILDKKSNSTITIAENRKLLRRSASTSIHFDDIMKITTMQPPLPTSKTIANLSSAATDNKSNLVSLKKRYSADYSAFATRQQQQQHQLGLKPRNNSEMYIKPDSFGSGLANTRRRPSSLDLLSAANNTSNMIGKMSSQFKSNHQNALRVTVDHKLRDVCTQEYLSSRAWHMRDRDAAGGFYYQSSPINTIPTLNSSASSNDLLKKRKSTSFIRSSASSFSIIIPKRQSELKVNPTRYSEYELNSNASSCSSSVDRSSTPIQNNSSRRPSQSSQLFRRMSQNKGCLSESPISFDNNSSISSFHENTKRIERSPSRRQIFVGKILRRISSFHQKPPASTSFESSTLSFNLEEVRKTASIGTIKKMRWKRHEELVQLQVNDRPPTTSLLKEQHDPIIQSPTTPVISAFAYASTPPLVHTSEELKKTTSRNSINRSWKNRLSLISPSSFLKINSSNGSINSNSHMNHGSSNIS